jgi:hypothetical protein
MLHLITALITIQIALSLLTLFTLTRKPGGLTRRELRGVELGRLAVAYAERFGGSSEQKLLHALSCFHTLDKSDGKVDYSGAEARIYIEGCE